MRRALLTVVLLLPLAAAEDVLIDEVGSFPRFPCPHATLHAAAERSTVNVEVTCGVSRDLAAPQGAQNGSFYELVVSWVPQSTQFEALNATLWSARVEPFLGLLENHVPVHEASAEGASPLRVRISAGDGETDLHVSVTVAEDLALVQGPQDVHLFLVLAP
jgi:hypothetical protein